MANVCHGRGYMVKIHNYDDWTIYDGLSSGSGASEKCWFRSNDEKKQIGLFKFPKTQESGNLTTEYISEHLACKIGNELKIPTAVVDIGYRDGRLGCMSYQINSIIEEGVSFISNRYPSYDMDNLFAEDEGMYYCLDMIIDSVGDTLEEGWFIPMLLFDFIIGNTDRHHSNWAIVTSYEGQKKLCPLYDNGSSLCCYIDDDKVLTYLGKDKMRFDSLVKSKSRSRIRIDGSKKKEPRQDDVIKYVFSRYTDAKKTAMNYIEKLNPKCVGKLMDEYPQELLSDSRRALIEKFVNAKVEYLHNIVREK